MTSVTSSIISNISSLLFQLYAEKEKNGGATTNNPGNDTNYSYIVIIVCRRVKKYINGWVSYWRGEIVLINGLEFSPGIWKYPKREHIGTGKDGEVGSAQTEAPEAPWRNIIGGRSVSDLGSAEYCTTQTGKCITSIILFHGMRRKQPKMLT
ncbi:hypothetical protein LOAG_07169 [Loa loa]|uniref:Uncharacterized protein n=1 Tax=Loa loa TaxID=7209 RepID=A0A1S0TY23_LOALO|nr:hypothetical protein LOAG_07169 [Loa loa]EFO21319.1 hypothetical protein LOAG_07169 [Loa loa]